MNAFLIVNRRHQHQIDAMEAVAEGLEKHCISSVISDNYAPAMAADFIVCWGDRVPPHFSHKPRLILEAGYVNGQSGNYVQGRLRFISSNWNGLHGRADSGRLGCPPDRFAKLGVTLRPWTIGGHYALVCGQHPGDICSPSQQQMAKILDEAERHYERVLFRPHPLLATGMRPLAESLEDAMACITWSSTCAVESVFMGVPTVALDRGSIAWPVTSHSINGPLYRGQRQQWANDLAYRQWTHDELRSGEAWDTLKHGWITTTPSNIANA